MRSLRGIPPNRRARERPLVQAAVAASVVAAVAAGVGLATRAHYAAEGGSTASVLDVEPSAVRGVVVASKDRQVELTRMDDGQWAGAAGVSPATRTLMVSSEDELFPLRAFRAVTADSSDPQLGLSEPEIRFDVTDATGARHQVSFGAPTFTDGGFYASVAGESQRVYLVPKRMVYDLRSVLAGHRVDPPDEVPKKVRDLDEKAKVASERAKVSYWLRQSLDSGTPVPDELR